MKKQILSIIAASIMLAAPCLNAGFAEWISANMPQSMRLSQEYRDEIKYMKDKTGNTVPVISYKVRSYNVLGSTINFDLAFLRFSLVGINEDIFSERDAKDDNSITLAHELTHVKKNHGGNGNAILRLGLSFAPVAGLILSRYLPSDSEDHTGLGINQGIINACVVSSVALAGANTLHSLYTEFNSNPAVEKEKRQEAYKIDEAEAEEGAINTLQALGYCKALQHSSQSYKSISFCLSEDYRPRGSIYPTLKEYAIWYEKALAECQGINPAERPDSENIMRNGTPPPPAETNTQKPTSL